jgi:hypothetical protein
MNREIIVYDDKRSAPATDKNILPQHKQSGMNTIMKRQANQMNKWKQILLLGGSMLFCASSFAGTSDITLTWDVVDDATHYQIEREVDSAWVIQTEQPISTNQITLVDLESGEQKFRVSGCVEELGVTIHCGVAVADYAEESFTIGDFLQRRVIFIHTDLLGSPAAETDEQGKVQ